MKKRWIVKKAPTKHPKNWDQEIVYGDVNNNIAYRSFEDAVVRAKEVAENNSGCNRFVVWESVACFDGLGIDWLEEEEEIEMKKFWLVHQVDNRHKARSHDEKAKYLSEEVANDKAKHLARVYRCAFIVLEATACFDVSEVMQVPFEGEEDETQLGH